MWGLGRRDSGFFLGKPKTDTQHFFRGSSLCMALLTRTLNPKPVCGKPASGVQGLQGLGFRVEVLGDFGFAVPAFHLRPLEGLVLKGLLGRPGYQNPGLL